MSSQAKFTLVSPDAIDVSIDPCSEALSQMGINRFVFSYEPDEQALSCLEPIKDNPTNNIWIYRRK